MKRSYFDEGLPVLGDWDFNVRFALSYEIVVLAKMLARWHIRYESASDPANNSTNTSMDLPQPLVRPPYELTLFVVGG